MRDLIFKYQSLVSEITKLKENIAAVYYDAASPKIKNITDMPLAPGFSNGGLENTFIRIEELDKQVHVCEAELEQVAAHIETKLDLAGIGGTARVLFWYREVHCKKWREISRLTDKSVRQLQRIYQKDIYTSLLL